ncbi:MAG: nucleoside triphosphate pyrophosphohydrolase [Candidatus Wallacebacter cryptica]|jgi:tetrapyrrole methylase family protein/MazG family protein|nr:nucleoside triphosphate pyrophosphohydrolase [Bacillota bacterium]
MARYTLASLIEIMAQLRSEEGCPWDREQTHQSLTRYLIEEAYEVIDAIEEQDDQALAEELGDVLLQVVFHAQIGAEDGRFTMDDVLNAVCEKMIRRHPHVFADTEVHSVKDVLSNWEAIKRKEKANQDRESLLDGIPRHLPALLRAEKVQSKASKVGFDWDDISGTFAKLEEEIEEFKQAAASGNQDQITAEMGDLFFSLVNICRFLNINPEQALNLTTDKFIRRFQYIEKEAARENRELNTMSLAEMDQLWEKAKKDS